MTYEPGLTEALFFVLAASLLYFVGAAANSPLARHDCGSRLSTRRPRRCLEKQDR